MSRASLVDVYVAALPFVRLAIVAIPGGKSSRVAVGGEVTPGEKIAQQFYFKASHVELVLGTAGLGDGPIDQPPDAVAKLIEKAAKNTGAPHQSPDELRVDAEHEVDKILERVQATNQAGGLCQLNRQYKLYRQAQIAKAEKAQAYSKFIEEHYTIGIIRSVASVGRMIA